jgi:hypothetical protein
VCKMGAKNADRWSQNKAHIAPTLHPVTFILFST